MTRSTFTAVHSPAADAVRVRRLTDHRVHRRPTTRPARSGTSVLPRAASPTASPSSVASPGPALADSVIAPPPTRPAAWPPPGQPELRRLLVAVLEVLDGRRPIVQLEPLLSPSDHRDLLRQLRKPGQGPRRLCTLRVQQPDDDAIELCATVADGNRLRALVGRLETHQDRWRFTLLRFL